jgi:hypothetical protein
VAAFTTWAWRFARRPSAARSATEHVRNRLAATAAAGAGRAGSAVGAGVAATATWLASPGLLTAAPAKNAPVPRRATASTPPVIDSASRCVRVNAATDAPKPGFAPADGI